MSEVRRISRDNAGYVGDDNDSSGSSSEESHTITYESKEGYDEVKEEETEGGTEEEDDVRDGAVMDAGEGLDNDNLFAREIEDLDGSLSQEEEEEEKICGAEKKL